MTPAGTPYALLRREVERDGARPLVTWYDDATGERIELSAVTFENWVAKTANLLQDGLGVRADARVGVALPAHWQSLVWVLAVWAVGACVAVGETADVDVAVVGPAGVAGAGAPEVVALALRPLGGRFVEPLPAGVLDYAVEVPSYADRFAPAGGLVPPEVRAWADPPHTQGGVLRAALDVVATVGVADGARVLVTRDVLDLDLVVDALLVPLVVGGSTVLVSGAFGDQVGRAEQERVTLRL